MVVCIACVALVGGCMSEQGLKETGKQRWFSVGKDYASVYYLINARAQEDWQGTILNATILLAQGYIHPAEETARVIRFSWNDFGRVVDRTVYIDKVTDDVSCVSIFSLDEDGIVDVEHWLRAAYHDVTATSEECRAHTGP